MRRFTIKNGVLQRYQRDLGGKVITLEEMALKLSRTDNEDTSSAAAGITSNMFDIVIPNHVHAIAKHAFLNCKNVKSVCLPETIRRIEADAFKQCTGLSLITIPDQSKIEGAVFEGCSKLKIVMASAEKKSELYSFYSNIKDLVRDEELVFSPELTQDILMHIKIRNKKAVLKQFIDCDNVEVLDFLLGSKFIANTQIRDELIEYASCNQKTETLTALLAYKSNTGNPVKEEKAREKKAARELNMSLEQLRTRDLRKKWSVRYTTAKKEAYKLCGYRGFEADIEIPTEIAGIPVTGITTSVFSENARKEKSKQHIAFQELSIPFGIKRIDHYAFEGCKSLKRISVPESITKIANGLFSDCSSLEEVILPDSITTIGYRAFQGCSSLKTIQLPKSVEIINNSAFSHCSNLREIAIPENVTSIFPFTFFRCRKLEAVIFPETMEQIHWSAFGGCQGLKKLIIPDSVYEIDIAAFENCDSLEEIRLSKNLTSISPGTFSSCTSLQYVQIPEKVTLISSYAFFGCRNLKKITLSGNLRKIAKFAFSGCPDLKISAPAGSYAMRYAKRNQIPFEQIEKEEV